MLSVRTDYGEFMSEEMSKEEVIGIIKRNLDENLHDVDVDEVTPESSMRDYGANSLDIIEVVSATMRELQIRVPRSELSEVENIDQLADKFMEYL